MNIYWFFILPADSRAVAWDNPRVSGWYISRVCCGFAPSKPLWLVTNGLCFSTFCKTRFFPLLFVPLPRMGWLRMPVVIYNGFHEQRSRPNKNPTSLDFGARLIGLIAPKNASIERGGLGGATKKACPQHVLVQKIPLPQLSGSCIRAPNPPTWSIGKALIFISDSLPFIHVQTGSRDDTGRTEFRGGYVRGNTMIGSR